MIHQPLHVLPEVATQLELPAPKRIELCQKDVWIPYTRAAVILDELKALVAHPSSIRMPNVLIVGRAANGKSSLLERFARLHPLGMRPNGTPDMPIVRIVMPQTPKEGNFWSAILWALNVGHRDRDPPERKQSQVMEMLAFIGARVLVIDELNHLANAAKEAGRVLAAMKNLSTVLRISIVAAGTHAAVNALRSDEQLLTRFRAQPLDRWALDKEYLRLLASYEQLLPLAQPSNLASRELAPMIYARAGDVLGGTVSVLRRAACRAIECGKERIDAPILESLGTTRYGSDWEDALNRS